MRLLHVITTMDPDKGGVSEAVRTMSDSLEKLGISNSIVTLDSAEASFLFTDKLPIIALGPEKGPWSYSSTLIPWLKKNLVFFDAVIVHGLWLYHTYAVRKAIQSKERQASKELRSYPKLFVMPHGMLDPYFQKASGRKLKALRNWIYWKLIENKVVNEAHGLLFTCESECELAQLPFRPYHPKREMIVGLGVREPPPFKVSMHNAFSALCSGLSGSSYLLYLGRIHEKKGIDLLIKAFEKTFCAEDQPISKGGTLPGVKALPVKLIIAGPGLDTLYGQKIKKMIYESEVLQARVLFTGMVTGDAKWGAFYGCEAFVLPSHQENFGIAIIEAMACGKPVLISDKVNVWKEISESGGGLVAEDTQKKTQEMLERWGSLSFEVKQNMGRRARKCYEEFFSISATSHRLRDAITK